MKGTFIAIEGLDGSGKSTLRDHIAEWYKERGIEVVRTREPGGTFFAEHIRDLVKYGHHQCGEVVTLSPLVKTLLLNAARRDHLDRVILPSLEKGLTVVCDRFVATTLAYQGAACGIDQNVLKQLHKDFCGDVQPDVTFWIDATGEQTLNIVQGRRIDELDELQLKHAKVMWDCFHQQFHESNRWKQVRYLLGEQGMFEQDVVPRLNLLLK